MKDIKLIADLIRTDRISVLSKGGRRGGAIFCAVTALFLTLFGVFITPDFLAVLMIMLSFLVVPMIVGVETRSGSERMLCILPVKRDHIVAARYIEAFSLITVSGIFLYLMTMASLRLGSSNSSVIFEIFYIFMKLFEIPGSMQGMIKVTFTCCYVFGAVIMSFQLRSYFKNGNSGKKTSLIGKVVKIILVCIAFVIAVKLFGMFMSAEIFSAMIKMLVALGAVLSTPADGLLLSVVLLVFGAAIMVYNMICSMIEYGQREI